MKRGDFVTISLSGDYGKPRPALVIQADFFDRHPSVTILPVTSTLYDTPLFRVAITQNGHNGLRKPSQIMVDKVMTVAREKVGVPFGKIDDATMLEVDRCLAVFLGITK